MLPQPFGAISIKISNLYEAENQQQQHQLNRLVIPTVAQEKDPGSNPAAFPACFFPVPSTPLRNTSHAKAGRGTSTPESWQTENHSGKIPAIKCKAAKRLYQLSVNVPKKQRGCTDLCHSQYIPHPLELPRAQAAGDTKAGAGLGGPNIQHH